MKRKKDEEHENDYLSMYTKFEDKNFQDGKKIPYCILRNFYCAANGADKRHVAGRAIYWKSTKIPKLYELLLFS